jgi:hypothetical protein
MLAQRFVPNSARRLRAWVMRSLAWLLASATGSTGGCLFDDYGRIYLGSTADDAAKYTVGRLAVLGGELRSYTVQEDGIQ